MIEQTHTTEYLKFEESTSPSGKTKVVAIESLSSGDTLGYIKWFGRWRQYTFFPVAETVWNVGCLDDVNAYIGKLMAERRPGG